MSAGIGEYKTAVQNLHYAAFAARVAWQTGVAARIHFFHTHFIAERVARWHSHLSSRRTTALKRRPYLLGTNARR
jgi:hypothetical protein